MVIFLKHLKEACPTLHMQNVIRRCGAYKYFTFVSDRDKGLIEAMKEVFPENLHAHCAVHIERNVLTRFGLPASKCIQQIAKTFSVQKERLWLLQLNKISPKAYEYILSIDPTTWRTSSWSKDETLPPRYGITSSNISEATNSMFDKARNCPWLY
jgi:transposase-like protein